MQRNWLTQVQLELENFSLTAFRTEVLTQTLTSDLDLQFRESPVMTNTQAKGQGQSSLGSKLELKRRDRGDCVTSRDDVVIKTAVKWKDQFSDFQQCHCAEQQHEMQWICSAVRCLFVVDRIAVISRCGHCVVG